MLGSRLQLLRTILPMGLALGGLACSASNKSAGDSPPGGAASKSLSADPINRALHASWDQAAVAPSPRASDAEFVRRVHLDLIGRIPTRQEARAFLASERGNKRVALVDRLLAGDEYAEHWADVYMDELFGNDPKTRKQAEGVRAWLVEELDTDRPWNELVDALVTAEGDQVSNPAVAFVGVHDRREKLAGPANATTSSLLGVQMGCAQCHDHPYDAYTREDFWAMGAFYARMRTSVDRSGGARRFTVANKHGGEARIAAEGSERKKKVLPRFLGREVVIEKGADRRAVLSREIQASPLMAKAATGRNWTALFGRGIVSPWNDLGSEQAEHPELLEVLAEDFASDGYSLKAQLRTMVLSEAYQRSSVSAAGVDVDASRAVFAQAEVRPLSVHQLFNSLMISTGLESSGNQAFRKAVTQRKNRALQEYVFTFGDEEMLDTNAFSGNVPQALLLLNGGLTNAGVVARHESLVERVVAQADTPSDRLDELFLSAYSRLPTDEERGRMLELIDDHGGEEAAPYEDLLFALLLSSEFLSNH